MSLRDFQFYKPAAALWEKARELREEGPAMVRLRGAEGLALVVGECFAHIYERTPNAFEADKMIEYAAGPAMDVFKADDPMWVCGDVGLEIATASQAVHLQSDETIVVTKVVKLMLDVQLISHVGYDVRIVYADLGYTKTITYDFKIIEPIVVDLNPPLEIECYQEKIKLPL